MAPWVHKYRPLTLDKVVAQRETVEMLRSSLTTSNLPHLLFYGPPGSGKTSAITAVCNDLFGPSLARDRVLELNASDDRGIEAVRKIIKPFVKKTLAAPSKKDLAKHPCPPFCVVILEEADAMTEDAQAALRRIIEANTTRARFCILCNYPAKIIDALSSRCSRHRFMPVADAVVLETLSMIAREEKVGEMPPGGLEKIVEYARGDLRLAINFLQAVHCTCADPTLEYIAQVVGEVPAVLPSSIGRVPGAEKRVEREGYGALDVISCEMARCKHEYEGMMLATLESYLPASSVLPLLAEARRKRREERKRKRDDEE